MIKSADCDDEMFAVSLSWCSVASWKSMSKNTSCEGSAGIHCFPAVLWHFLWVSLPWSVLQKNAAWAVVEGWEGRLVGLCRCLALIAAGEARSIPLQRLQADTLSPKNAPLKWNETLHFLMAVSQIGKIVEWDISFEGSGKQWKKFSCTYFKQHTTHLQASAGALGQCKGSLPAAVGIVTSVHRTGECCQTKCGKRPQEEVKLLVQRHLRARVIYVSVKKECKRW